MEETRKTDSTPRVHGKHLSVASGSQIRTPLKENDTPCKQFVDEHWIACDLCDNGYHMNGVGLSCTSNKIEKENVW